MTLKNKLEFYPRNIKCIQFEIWHNCSNGCQFCYLNNHKVIYTEQEKQDSIRKVMNILESDKVVGYNAVGLIGGELFGNQQDCLETRKVFLELVSKIKGKLDSEVIKEVWLTSNLITDNLSPLIDTLEILMRDYSSHYRIMICTSYDTAGRFHSSKSYNQWYKNLYKIHKLFPGLCIHIQTICTQSLIDEWFKNKDKFIEFTREGFLLDFKPPAITAYDFIYYNTGLETFREFLMKFDKLQSYKYIIESRSEFLEFWEDVSRTLPNGIQKLKDFTSNYVKSECCYSVPWDKWINDRWDNKIENASCGHCWDGYSYRDYPDKCCKCDVEKLVKFLEDKR